MSFALTIRHDDDRLLSLTTIPPSSPPLFVHDAGYSSSTWRPLCSEAADLIPKTPQTHEQVDKKARQTVLSHSQHSLLLAELLPSASGLILYHQLFRCSVLPTFPFSGYHESSSNTMMQRFRQGIPTCADLPFRSFSDSAGITREQA